MKDFQFELQSKWGDFVQIASYRYQCKLPFISSVAVLNLLFDCEKELINNLFSNHFKTLMPNGLRDFYNKSNGCRLFFSSLNVFGIQCHSDNLFEPYDLIVENANIQSTFEDNNYIFFASLGGDYVFAYRKDEVQQIYAFENGGKIILKTFENFNEWFNYYFEGLLTEYDLEGKKKHPNEKYSGIPALYHVTNKLF